MLPLYIAKRYLFGKKSKNVINYISAISVLVVAIVTMALFVALSVFNGLEGLIISMYDSFDADLKITPTAGKVFVPDSRFEILKKNKGVISYSEVLEEDVLLKYGDKQFIGRMKGVSDSYKKTTQLDENIKYGDYMLRDSAVDYMLVGQGLAYSLSIGLQLVEPVHVYAPSRNAKKIAAPEKSYKHTYAYPVAVFQTQQDVDNKYFITSLSFARDLLGYKGEVSAVELSVDSEQVASVKAQIKGILGPGFDVKDRYEQHDFIYKVLKSEKWGIFLIVSFILLIASFNVVGSLTMLIIDKRKDISILQSMGAESKLIKQIFLFEGWMISFLGAVIGLVIGIVLCWLQMQFGLLKLAASGNFVVESYPVEIKTLDILWVFLVVMVIGFLAAYIPVMQISKTKGIKL